MRIKVPKEPIGYDHVPVQEWVRKLLWSDTWDYATGQSTTMYGEPVTIPRGALEKVQDSYSRLLEVLVENGIISFEQLLYIVEQEGKGIKEAE
jgi:hypothetical protein